MPKNKILLVEDSDLLSELLVRLLSVKYETFALSDASNIIQKCKEIIPDLILLDVMLPGELDGMGAIRLIKDQPDLRAIPVIFISAISSTDMVNNGLKLGANDYLVKPFDLKQLELKIQNLIYITEQVRQRTTFEKNIPEKLRHDDDTSILSQFNKLIDHYLVIGKVLNLDNIVQDLNMSHSTLNRLIKKRTGQTPNNYIMGRKLEKAKILLEGNYQTPIKDVAFSMGFNSVAYFSKCFKQRFGIFPTQVLK